MKLEAILEEAVYLAPKVYGVEPEILNT